MIYSLCLALYILVTAPFYAARILRGRHLGSVGSRMGRGLPPEPPGRTLWIHACSVGEVEAALPLVVLARRDHPDLAFIISTVTETGQARARQLFPDDQVRYFPYDFLFAVRRHLDTAGDLVGCLILETELWPNFLGELRRRGVPVVVANGRVSDRAWFRYRIVAPFFRATMRTIALVAARTEEDAARFRYLGAPRVEVMGNVKFDRPAGTVPADAPTGRFLIFGSTHPGEEALALRVFERLRVTVPDLRLLIAPRHTERGALVAKETGGALRSRGWRNERVLVLDTHGELGGLYAIADAAVIGGTFVPVGGHNPLEAAVHGVPVCWGPHIANFKDACGILEGRGGRGVRDEQELESVLAHWLTNASERVAYGMAGREAVLANRGAAARQWRAAQDAMGLPR